MKIKLFYDKDCPFCNSYANYIKLNEKHDLELLNARENLEILKKLKSKGFNINDGFIIEIDKNTILQGSQAIIFLNKLAQKRVYFPNNRFFKELIYPIVKLIRKLFLKILGKKVDVL